MNLVLLEAGVPCKLPACQKGKVCTQQLSSDSTIGKGKHFSWGGGGRNRHSIPLEYSCPTAMPHFHTRFKALIYQNLWLNQWHCPASGITTVHRRGRTTKARTGKEHKFREQGEESHFLPHCTGKDSRNLKHQKGLRTQKQLQTLKMTAYLIKTINYNRSNFSLKYVDTKPRSSVSVKRGPVFLLCPHFVSQGSSCLAEPALVQGGTHIQEASITCCFFTLSQLFLQP